MAGKVSVLDDAVDVQFLLWGYAVTGVYFKLDAAWERGYSGHPELWDRTRRELSDCWIGDEAGWHQPPDWWALAGAFDYMNRKAA